MPDLDATARGWGDPGDPHSEQEAQYRRDHIAVITLHCGVRLSVRKEVSQLFKGFFDELEATTGYKLADGGRVDDGGFNNRPNANNPKVKSNHSWGLAVDANSDENPNTHDGIAHTNMPVADVRRLAKKWGLRWGGDYTGKTKDPMHFEFMGTPDDVAKFPLGDPTPTNGTGDDDEMTAIFYRVSVDPKNSKTADGDAAIWVTTDKITTHVVSGPAFVHGKNLGWYDESKIAFVPKDFHDWLVQNTHGQNAPLPVG